VLLCFPWQILGADSGWQPVPLTDLITAVAVKKAYRKATLCVHPDKLQQRGATIRQKYICEKVFDLLKVCALSTLNALVIWNSIRATLSIYGFISGVSFSFSCEYFSYRTLVSDFLNLLRTS
jgi:hypothetical protein